VYALTEANTVPGHRPAQAPDRTSDIENQIQVIEGLDLAGLRKHWRRKYGRQPVPGLGRNFMIRAIAYRIQADALGDLDRKTIRTLEQLAAGNADAIIHDRSPGRNLQPGTELVREYQGQHHRVTVVRDGFSWNGNTYSTLSGVAKAITGSNWNGYAFFGLTVRRRG
jgi:hypothetical protein